MKIAMTTGLPFVMPMINDEELLEIQKPTRTHETVNILRHKAGVSILWQMFIQSHLACDFPLSLSTHDNLWIRLPPLILCDAWPSLHFLLLVSLELGVPSLGHAVMWIRMSLTLPTRPTHLLRCLYAVGLQSKDSSSYLHSSHLSKEH